MSEPAPSFTFGDDPDHPGWSRWTISDTTRFNSIFGPLSVKLEDGIARVRFTPAHIHSNLRGHVHGGALLGFIDMAMFAAGRSFGVLTAGTAATLDLTTQFIAGAPLEAGVIEARVELLRETGRLLFLRGLIVQGESIIVSFTGT
ncbi:MAG: PaaI family thioesterase, partial [Pseudomonadota bacterium]